MSEITKEFTNAEIQDASDRIRKADPEMGAVLDQVAELKDRAEQIQGRMQVVDKRRLAELHTMSPSSLDDPAFEAKRQFAEEHRITYGPAQESPPEMVGSFGRKLNTEFSPSANPDKAQGMDFSSAIKLVKEGKRVTRLEWNNPDIWLMMFYWGDINPKTPAGKYLSIHHADGAMNPLYINDGDMLGDDWVVVV